MIQYGYFALDLHEYGVATGNATTGYTFTYNIKSLSRLYGISYDALTADDFVVGYKQIADGEQHGKSGSSNGQGGDFISWSKVGTPSVSYDATEGKLTVSNIQYYFSAQFSHPYATGGGYYYADITSNDIICMLVPRSVIVD